MIDREGNAYFFAVSRWESLAQWAKGRNVVLNLRHKILQIRHNDDNMMLQYTSHDPLLHPGWLGCVCLTKSRLFKNNVLMFSGYKICYVVVIAFIFSLFVSSEFVFFHVEFRNNI